MGDKHTFKGLNGQGVMLIHGKPYSAQNRQLSRTPYLWRQSQDLLRAASAEKGMGRKKRGLTGRTVITPLLLPQLVKKVAQSGDTACLQHTLDIFHHEDLKLLQGHCHTRALSILRAQPGGPDSEAHTREAITYLSLAIFATGRNPTSPGVQSWARCMEDMGSEDKLGLHSLCPVASTVRTSWDHLSRSPKC